MYAVGRTGILGRYLGAAGVVLPYTTSGVVVVQTFVAIPYVVVAAEAAFRSTDRRLEEAAATLGAGPRRLFWRVSIPLARSGLIASALLAWARALGEYGATITFAGNLPGTTQTLPLAISLALENDPAAAVVTSGVLVIVCLGVLLAVNRTAHNKEETT